MARYDTYLAGDDRFSEDLDVGYIGINNRLRPDQLQRGILADSQNGRMNQNGEWQTRKGIGVLKAPLSTGGSALTLPFFLMDADITTSSVAVTSNELILNFGSAHGLGTSGTGQVQLNTSSASISPATASGLYTITITSATQIKLSDKTYSSASGDVVVTKPAIADDAVNAVYGSCIFSDPNSNSEAYIVLAGNTKAFAVNIANPATVYELDYPSGETVSSEVTMLQAFNKLFIFRDNDTPFEKDLAATNINTSPSFDKVTSGSYTQPQLITSPSSGFAISNNVATVDLGSGTHGLSVGDTIELITVANSGLTLGDRFTVSTVVDANEFKFFANAPDVSAGASVTPVFSKPVSVSLGFAHMPGAKYGVYHQRRLVLPFRFETTGTDTYTDRKIFDEVIFSNILDTDTYDQAFGHFRFNAGKSDFNVGMLSFSDDKLIVFNRNSIHLVSNSINLENSLVQLLTDEIGLVARESISQVGNQILFLSDNGVYGLTFMDRYNLRGTEVPLSESIQTTIDSINKEHADKASSVYFDNKYYLAIPTDGSSFNNKIIIYNFLNKSWESIDSVNNLDDNGNELFTAFEFTKLLVGGKGKDKGVYVVNGDGGIHKLEENDDGVDRIITNIGETSEKEAIVNGIATTRMFTLNSIDRKKFNNFELHLQSGTASSNANITATTENLDEEAIDLGSASSFTGGLIDPEEDVSIRGRIGNKRAYGIQFTINSTLGRPRFRSLKVAGSETFRTTSTIQ